jgi:hypothetical protein
MNKKKCNDLSKTILYVIELYVIDYTRIYYRTECYYLDTLKTTHIRVRLQTERIFMI